MVRHLPYLVKLSVWSIGLGWEGVSAIGSTLLQLGELRINEDGEEVHGVGLVGRLPNLR